MPIEVLKFCSRGPHQGFGALSRKGSSSTPKYPHAKWGMKNIQEWCILLNQRNSVLMTCCEMNFQRVYQNKCRNKSLLLTAVQPRDLCSHLMKLHVRKILPMAHNTPILPLLNSGGVSGTTSQKICSANGIKNKTNKPHTLFWLQASTNEGMKKVKFGSFKKVVLRVNILLLIC